MRQVRGWDRGDSDPVGAPFFETGASGRGFRPLYLQAVLYRRGNTRPMPASGASCPGGPAARRRRNGTPLARIAAGTARPQQYPVGPPNWCRCSLRRRVRIGQVRQHLFDGVGGRRGRKAPSRRRHFERGRSRAGVAQAFEPVQRGKEFGALSPRSGKCGDSRGASPDGSRPDLEASRSRTTR